ncbi:MAG: thioesterase family protein [Pseudomonadota bacterium]
MRPEPPQRSEYKIFRPITTRWMDNDVYGHVNNVIYYSFFDTAVSGWLVGNGLVDYATGETIGLCVDSRCAYYAPISFPEDVTAGVRVDRIGSSSVVYAVGIFKNAEDQASAAGTFTHVYVDAETRRPRQLAEPMRRTLASIQIST